MNQKFVFTAKEIKRLSAAGNAAPSGGNTQPWKVFFDKNKISIGLDPIRSTSFLDVAHYASFFACGCFTENMCQAADDLALDYKVKILPYKKASDILIEIIVICRLLRKKTPNLAKYIPLRITNRQLSDGSVINSKTMASLQQLLSSNAGFSFHAVADYERKKTIADVLGVVDGIRTLNDSMFAQMMDEFRFTSQDVKQTRDGLDMETLELPAHAHQMLQLLKKFPHMRSVIPKKAFEQFSRPLLLECSHLCTLSFKPELNPESMILAGRVLERLWLTTTKMGIAFQPWSILPFFKLRITKLKGEGFTKLEQKAILQVDKDLHQLFEIESKDSIVFIFRISTAKPASARSLRIPWQDYTTIGFDVSMK